MKHEANATGRETAKARKHPLVRTRIQVQKEAPAETRLQQAALDNVPGRHEFNIGIQNKRKLTHANAA
jgi:hypothetical protein